MPSQISLKRQVLLVPSGENKKSFLPFFSSSLHFDDKWRDEAVLRLGPVQKG